MLEKNNITDYFVFIREVFKRATECWQNGEGKMEVSVKDDNENVEGKVSGGPTFRSHKAKRSGEDG